MSTAKRLAVLMMAVGVALMAVQLYLTFWSPITASQFGFQDQDLAIVLLNMAPYILLVSGLLLLRGRGSGMSGRSTLIRIVYALIAAWGAAGGLFLSGVMIAFLGGGAAAVEHLFSNFAVIITVLTVAGFPVMYRCCQ